MIVMGCAAMSCLKGACLLDRCKSTMQGRDTTGERHYGSCHISSHNFPTLTSPCVLAHIPFSFSSSLECMKAELRVRDITVHVTSPPTTFPHLPPPVLAHTPFSLSISISLSIISLALSQSSIRGSCSSHEDKG
jgi:hypothetical protein